MRHGYSLVEVMIAAILVSLTIFAAFSLYASCNACLRMSHAVASADAVAQQVIETATATPFEDLDKMASTTPVPLDGITYQVNVAVAPFNQQNFHDDQGNPNVKEITVFVTWISGSMQGEGSLKASLCVYDYINSP